jgi:hypothetical protein
MSAITPPAKRWANPVASSPVVGDVRKAVSDKLKPEEPVSLSVANGTAS